MPSARLQRNVYNTEYAYTKPITTSSVDMAKSNKGGATIAKYKKTVRMLSLISYFSIIVSIAAIAFASYSILHPSTKTVYVNRTVIENSTTAALAALQSYNVTSSLITPSQSLADAGVITTQAPFGSRLTKLNAPLNSTELTIINNAPDSYFEKAGEMYLNGSLKQSQTMELLHNAQKIPPFLVNGKPTVIYFGSTTCIFCAENRWAMALALSRFGNFSSLFKGYSALKDSDAPTLYWAPSHYNSSTIDFGSFYNSNNINFIAIEDTAPISGGFSLQPLNVMQREVNATGNTAYMTAFKYILQIGTFQGTPYTIWGNNVVSGVDAVDFGNASSNGQPALLTMTHESILNQLSNPNNQFSWTEYAAADLYIAMLCSSMNNTSTISACSLPAIKQIESENGY